MQEPPQPPPVQQAAVAQTSFGYIHARLQEYFQQQFDYYRVNEKVLSDEEEMGKVFGAVDAVLKCVDPYQAADAERSARAAIDRFVSAAWHKKLAKGPATPHRLDEEAKKKESFAKWRISLGGEDNREKANKALLEAKALRQQAESMRLKEEQARAAREEPVTEGVVEYWIPKKFRRPGEPAWTTDPNRFKNGWGK